MKVKETEKSGDGADRRQLQSDTPTRAADVHTLAHAARGRGNKSRRCSCRTRCGPHSDSEGVLPKCARVRKGRAEPSRECAASSRSAAADRGGSQSNGDEAAEANTHTPLNATSAETRNKKTAHTRTHIRIVYTRTRAPAYIHSHSYPHVHTDTCTHTTRTNETIRYKHA